MVRVKSGDENVAGDGNWGYRGRVMVRGEIIGGMGWRGVWKGAMEMTVTVGCEVR